MSEKNFMNIHVLISHSPSCLNRDDMNMQKSAVFGGVRRVRISSQSLKRAIRKSDLYARTLGEPSVRTRDLKRLKAKYAELLQAEFPLDVVEEVIDLIAGTGKFKKEEKEKKKGGKKGEEQAEATEKSEKDGQAVAPWSVAEVRKICQLAAPKLAGSNPKELEKLVKESSGALLETLSQNAFDIALAGRMVTSGLMNPVDGAMAVAHAITTHAVDADVDWFTAMDDLIEEGSETGAGHLNTQEFSAGVFYRYASLNLGQLCANLGGIPRREAMEKAAHLVGLFATVVPTAKQNSFAAHNPADLVLVHFSDFPLSFANAFEHPVERPSRGGFIKPSIAALESYVRNVYSGYGISGSQAVFSLWETEMTPRLNSLEALTDWVKNDGVHR